MIKPGTLLNFGSSCVVTGWVLLASGCAVPTQADQAALMQEVQRSVPVCRESKECEVKWAAARDWIVKNSGRRLLVATSDHLETSPPISADQDSLQVRVIREPQQDGSYRMTVTVWCQSFSGCVTDKWVATKNFNDTVNASWHPALVQ